MLVMLVMLTLEGEEFQAQANTINHDTFCIVFFTWIRTSLAAPELYVYFATLKKLYDGIFMLQYISIHWNVIGNLMKNATWLLSMYAGFLG